ncbi:hypothetical protein [Microbulbifer sp. 2205BS26-8]|uniref:hypothetical protein n=1 Tax=Microbulbifer sp. 2205BS26-8 TaxID=3064386 RepID=UPI00273EA3AE|nr:hypothetical protein [Microbulbifer sp. 2205BS26-8]MDP5211293.1 hypothetical protein [Microbulbifer sp. 2205BS26-8]
MKRKFIAFVASLLFFCISIENWANVDTSIKNIYNQIDEVYESTRGALNKKKSSNYFYSNNLKPFLSNENLKNLSAIDLEYLFQAINRAVAYDPEIEYVNDMSQALSHLKQKNLIKNVI